MITFKQFLSEARMAPLYHATRFSNLEKILVTGLNGKTFQNQFKGNRSPTRGMYGISTARTIRASLNYYKNNVSNILNYVILELDHVAIRNKYKIFPVDYFATRRLMNYTGPVYEKGGEEEEFIITPSYTNSEYGFLPSKYIKRIFYINQPDEPIHVYDNTARMYNKTINNLKNSKLGRKFEWREFNA